MRIKTTMLGLAALEIATLMGCGAPESDETSGIEIDPPDYGTEGITIDPKNFPSLFKKCAGDENMLIPFHGGSVCWKYANKPGGGKLLGMIPGWIIQDHQPLVGNKQAVFALDSDKNHMLYKSGYQTDFHPLGIFLGLWQGKNTFSTFSCSTNSDPTFSCLGEVWVYYDAKLICHFVNNTWQPGLLGKCGHGDESVEPGSFQYILNPGIGITPT